MIKLVIAHGAVKREIDGHFNVCGDYDLLRAIAQQILDHIGDKPGYGWIEIVDPATRQDDIVNTPPRRWED